MISTINLPLKYKYEFQLLDIKPFTYKDILDYVSGYPSDKDEAYLYDLTWILRDDSNCANLLLPDAEYVIFLKKAISIDGDFIFRTEVKCPQCGRINKATINANEFNFVRPNDKVLYDGVWIELQTGTYLCKLPTVTKFLKIFELASTYKLTKRVDLVKTLSMINEIELNPMAVNKSILEAKSEDIPVIITAYDMLYKSLLPVKIECSNEECDLHKPNNGGMSIEIQSLIGNVFRSILLSKPVDRSKIYTK